MRPLKQIALLGIVFAAVLAWASPALASRGHQYTTSFGVHCLVEPGCMGEELFKPNGVAVNEATGDVYVVDEGEGAVGGRVVRYSKAGVFESEFNGSGLDGEGMEAGYGGESYEVKTGEFDKPEAIAVDNSCVLRKLKEPALAQVKCEAEDPSSGDVYVVDAGHGVIDKYTASGEYVGQIAAGEGGRFTQALAGVAVDPEGEVWVYQENLTISGFTDTRLNEFSPPSFSVARGERNFFGVAGFAVDSKGNFYGDTNPTVGFRIVKWNHAGALESEEVDGEESSAVATEPVADNVFVDNLTSVGVFNSEGEPVERLGKELGEEHLKGGAGVGVNASASAGSIIYVADAAAGEVVVFGPDEPAPPKVESNSESFANVTSLDASLEAKINPQSEPGETATEYYFEYGSCPTLDPGSCASAGYQEVSGSAGQLSPSYEPQQVGAVVEGLSPHTTYHFRAAARNSHSQANEYVPGKEQTFTTEGAGGELVLPDNRGWELVSPPNKEGALIEPLGETGVVQAAASGDGITYLANAPTEAQPEGYSNEVQVLSRRGASSWSSREIAIPHTSATGKPIGSGPEYKYFNPELTLGAVQPFGEFNPLLSEEALESTAYLHNITTPAGSCIPSSSCYVPLVTLSNDTTDPLQPFGEGEQCKPKVGGGGDAQPCGPKFLGASEDLNHVVLRSEAELMPGAGVGQLYEWNGGALARVSVLPGGSPAAAGARLGLIDKAARGAISSDGSRIAWEAAPDLYLRDMTSGVTGETVQLDKAEEVGGEPCEKCTSGGGRFQFANTEGSRVFFTSTHRLTNDSGAVNEAKADIYECQIVVEGGKLKCKLEDLTPKRVTPEHGEESAEVLGSVLGASSDGSSLYFVANGVQSDANGEGKRPTSGQPNLYVRHEGSTEFIATLSSGDETDWDVNGTTSAPLSGQPTRVSSDGQYLEFMSQASPTGYDNLDGDQPVAEVYLYDAATSKLVCASCLPTGVRPTGVEYKKLDVNFGGIAGGDGIWPSKALVAANVSGWTGMTINDSRYQPRYLNDEGRLFFNTADALVPQDSNGTEDVYEYEPAGIKGPENRELCTEASETYSGRSDGCVSLISSGSSAQESAFLDTSESGNDVFFLTKAQLSPLDADSSDDVYDAHVCTNASPCITYPTVQSPPCTTEASCKAAPSPQPSVFGAPPSATFQGLGNPAPAAVVKPKAKPLTRAQKLTKALTACHKDRKKAKRVACEKAAHGKYGPIKKSKKKGRK
jgi:hypothetical protein